MFYVKDSRVLKFQYFWECRFCFGWGGFSDLWGSDTRGSTVLLSSCNQRLEMSLVEQRYMTQPDDADDVLQNNLFLYTTFIKDCEDCIPCVKS